MDSGQTALEYILLVAAAVLVASVVILVGIGMVITGNQMEGERLREHVEMGRTVFEDAFSYWDGEPIEDGDILSGEPVGDGKAFIELGIGVEEGQKPEDITIHPPHQAICAENSDDASCKAYWGTETCPNCDELCYEDYEGFYICEFDAPTGTVDIVVDLGDGLMILDDIIVEAEEDRGGPMPICDDQCGNGKCQEIVCDGFGCPCQESSDPKSRDYCEADCGKGEVECRTQCDACTPENIECCDGLVEVSYVTPMGIGFDCIGGMCGKICLPCGNGTCDPGEDWCNCSSDCVEGEENTGEIDCENPPGGMPPGNGGGIPLGPI